MRLKLAAILTLLFSTAAWADAPAKEAACRACHGAKGAAPIVPSYPKLNGQNKEYLISALKAYKAGDRKGGLAAAMAAQTMSLSDDDIKALAEYYAAQ
jgi:cytochrome c